MIEFEICRLKISFDFCFFTVIALMFVLSDESQLIPAITACIIHETGHLIPITFCGKRISAIRFHGGGIKIIPAQEHIHPFLYDAIVMLGGCTANLLTSAMLAVRNPVFAMINFCIGIFNLLPYRSLDGGCFIEMVLEYFFPEHNIEIPLKIFCTLFSILLIFLIFTFAERNVTLIAVTVYLLATEFF